MLPPLTAFAHEVRTPLHGMLALVQLLERTPLDDEQRGHLAALGTAAARLLAFAEDALVLARVDDGALVVRDAPCAPRAVTEAVLATCAPLATGRGLALAMTVADDVPAEAHLDAGRVRQVLVNLVGNACKVTRAGGVTVRLRAEADGGLAWAVHDTGPGMTPGVCARLWTPWERAGAEAHDAEGAGLGLGLSRALARAMGGDLTVESVHGVGSTFTLRLPRAVVRPASRAVCEQLNPPAVAADTGS
jgi:signal transduction histidine kinase